MMGASVLSTIACLRSGAGKVSSYVPKCGYEIMQASIPEAMCIVSGENFILSVDGIEKFDAVGIGPGIGTQPTHTALLKKFSSKQINLYCLMPMH
ncbi:MAG: NAD(P)H-hydrate dehydratase [Ferruginibacter sp.]